MEERHSRQDRADAPPSNDPFSELRQFLAADASPLARFSPSVREVLEVIYERVFDPQLTVQEVRRRCRIGDNNFSCRFRHEVGASIKEYVDSLRLRAARHLLERTTLSAAEIAQMVGYSYAQTFYRAYERRYHERPGAIRRRTWV